MSKTVYKVFGYQHCSYASTACQRVQALEKTNSTIQAECTITSRTEYKAWLQTNNSVPSNHTSSPACFKDDEFIGGCSELCVHLDTKYPSSKPESFCLVQ